MLHKNEYDDRLYDYSLLTTMDILHLFKFKIGLDGLFFKIF